MNAVHDFWPLTNIVVPDTKTLIDLRHLWRRKTTLKPNLKNGMKKESDIDKSAVWHSFSYLN